MIEICNSPHPFWVRQLPAHLVLRCLIHCPMGLTCGTSFACTHAELKVLTESDSLQKYIHVCVCAHRRSRKIRSKKLATMCGYISIIQISTRVGFGPLCSWWARGWVVFFAFELKTSAQRIIKQLPIPTDTKNKAFSFLKWCIIPSGLGALVTSPSGALRLEFPHLLHIYRAQNWEPQIHPNMIWIILLTQF